MQLGWGPQTQINGLWWRVVATTSVQSPECSPLHNGTLVRPSQRPSAQHLLLRPPPDRPADQISPLSHGLSLASPEAWPGHLSFFTLSLHLPSPVLEPAHPVFPWCSRPGYSLPCPASVMSLACTLLAWMCKVPFFVVLIFCFPNAGLHGLPWRVVEQPQFRVQSAHHCTMEPS